MTKGVCRKWEPFNFDPVTKRNGNTKKLNGVLPTYKRFKAVAFTYSFLETFGKVPLCKILINPTIDSYRKTRFKKTERRDINESHA